MNFTEHSNLEGQHAFLGASKYHWINYSEDKLIESWKNYISVFEGTETHEFASLCIRRRQKLPAKHETLNMFVNDAIGFKMTSEQPLYFSENCFGTADAICFRKNQLRIHDLKTGRIPAHMEQLLVYAALFCLEYDFKPADINIELRIYQSNDIQVMVPTAEDIVPIMDKIVTFDKIIDRLKEEEL